MEAIELATQTGRLDFISALLAILATMLGLAAFPLFFFLRYRAEKIARQVAEEVLEGAIERIEQRAISHIERALPTLVADYGEIARNAVNDLVADQIAAAQEDAKNGDDADRRT